MVHHSHQKIGKRTRGLGNQNLNGVHQNFRIIKIDQSTEKSPGDMRRFAVTQAPVNLNGVHQHFRIIKIGQNTEKSPGDIRRLAVTQTPVNNHYITLLGKSS